MRTLVVVESMWGNSRAIAEAVARGVGAEAEVVEVGDAPAQLPAEVALLVVGGPTHAFSMSRSSTRREAVERGASSRGHDRGIREWLAGLPRSGRIDVATFDTRASQARLLPGSAAKAAAKEVHRQHLGRVVGTESFFVEDVQGPLRDGELERAEAWGAALVRGRAASGPAA
jgi:hypothetical protein